MDPKFEIVQEEIRYRQQLINNARSGIKLKPEERQWLATHPIYNRWLGYPYLNTDIIQLTSQKAYIVNVRFISSKYNDRIIPIISVPHGKGEITTVYSVTDLHGSEKVGRPIKSLGCLIDSSNEDASFLYQSKLGVLSVNFECDYFDEKQHLFIRKSSDTGDPNYSMLKEILDDNKIIYRCKAPGAHEFESMVFLIEFTESQR